MQILHYPVYPGEACQVLVECQARLKKPLLAQTNSVAPPPRRDHLIRFPHHRERATFSEVLGGWYWPRLEERDPLEYPW